MKKIFVIALLGVSLALTGCVQQTPAENQNLNQSVVNQNQNINQPVANINQNTNQVSTNVNQITASGNCINCAVSGSYYIPESNTETIETRITLYEYDPSFADVSADKFDEVVLTTDRNTNKIYFNLGQKELLKEDREYYISATSYKQVYWGKCNHGDFCKVLEPSQVTINAIDWLF